MYNNVLNFSCICVFPFLSGYVFIPFPCLHGCGTSVSPGEFVYFDGYECQQMKVKTIQLRTRNVKYLYRVSVFIFRHLFWNLWIDFCRWL